MSKYLNAAQKLVRDAGAGGGITTIEKTLPVLREIARMAGETEGKEVARMVMSLKEALTTANS
jgi:hypothetical protein